MNDSQDKKQKAKEKYHNGGGKEKSKEYYQANKEVIREKAKIRYQNLSEEQKELKRHYSRDRYKRLTKADNKIKYFFCLVHGIKMSPQKIKFGDKEVDKKGFYLSKHAIFLDSVDLSKIIVSNKWKINDTTCKYLCGYLNDDVVPPLCIILPQMSGNIKYFEDGAENMSFITDDEIWNMEIWNVIRKTFKVKIYC